MRRWGISLAPLDIEEKPAMAQFAEQAGADMIFSSGDSIPLFGALAVLTHRATIGSGVIRGFAYDARALAEHAIDIQRISAGRFVLGLGGGTKRLNISQLGQEFDHPATRLRELIPLLRTIWATPDGQPIDVQGTYYQLRGSGARNSYSEIAPPPIYLAAVNLAMLRLCGEVADGLCGHPIASVRFISDIVWPAIDAGLRRAGRTRAGFNHCAWICTAIANDRASALRELKLQVAYYMATRSYAIILDSQGLTATRVAIQEAFFQYPGDEDRLAAAVPDEVALAHGICGSPDDVRRQADRYADVAETPTFYPASRGMSRERRRENARLVIETFGR